MKEAAGIMQREIAETSTLKNWLDSQWFNYVILNIKKNALSL